jgi:hypothetical protein
MTCVNGGECNGCCNCYESDTTYVCDGCLERQYGEPNIVYGDEYCDDCFYGISQI